MYEVLENGWVLRVSDGAVIPPDEQNTDYQAYLYWKEHGELPHDAAF